MGMNMPQITPGDTNSFISTAGVKAAQHTGFAGNTGAEVTSEKAKIKNASVAAFSEISDMKKKYDEEIQQLEERVEKLQEQLEKEKVALFNLGNVQRVEAKKSTKEIIDVNTKNYRNILKDSENYFKLPKRQSNFQELQRGVSGDGDIVDPRGTVLTGLKARSADEAADRFMQMMKFMRRDQSKNQNLSDEERANLEKFRPTLKKWIAEAEAARKKDKSANPVFYFMDKVFKNYESNGVVRSHLLVPALELKNSVERVNQNVYNSFRNFNSASIPNSMPGNNPYGTGNPYMDNPLMGMGMPSMMGMPGMAGMSPGMTGMPGTTQMPKWMQYMPLILMGGMMIGPLLMGMMTQSMFMGGMMGGMGMPGMFF